MSFRRALRWMLPPLALIALAGWLASPRIAPGAADSTNAPQKDAGTVPALGPAAQPPSAAGPDRLAAVQKFVAQKNAEGSRQKEEFIHAGWEIVDAPPPDAKLVSADPSLLKDREPELRRQISSTSATPDMAPNLARIAREAKEEQTQVAAVEALGRAGDEGQDQLLDLIHQLPDGTLARREVAPLLHPSDLSDTHAARLAALLDSQDLNGVERKQIAFTLSLVGLRDRSTLPDAVLASLSPAARDLLASTTSLALLKH